MNYRNTDIFDGHPRRSTKTPAQRRRVYARIVDALVAAARGLGGGGDDPTEAAEDFAGAVQLYLDVTNHWGLDEKAEEARPRSVAEALFVAAAHRVYLLNQLDPAAQDGGWSRAAAEAVAALASALVGLDPPCPTPERPGGAEHPGAGHPARSTPTPAPPAGVDALDQNHP
jgi:hypothetical protein